MLALGCLVSRALSGIDPCSATLRVRYSAGIVVVQEAGGYMATGHPGNFLNSNVSIGEMMMGRRYCFVVQLLIHI